MAVLSEAQFKMFYEFSFSTECILNNEIKPAFDVHFSESLLHFNEYPQNTSCFKTIEDYLLSNSKVII